MSRYLSTMQRIAEENARLRLQARVSKITYWSALGVVVGVAILKIYGGWL